MCSLYSFIHYLEPPCPVGAVLAICGSTPRLRMDDDVLVSTLFVYGPASQRCAPIGQRIVRSDMSKGGVLASLL